MTHEPHADANGCRHMPDPATVLGPEFYSQPESNYFGVAGPGIPKVWRVGHRRTVDLLHSAVDTLHDAGYLVSLAQSGMSLFVSERMRGDAPELADALRLALDFIPEDAMTYSEGTHGERVYVCQHIRAALAKSTPSVGT